MSIKRSTTKKVVGTVSNHAAGFTVARVLVANTPINGGLYEKAAVLIGSFVIGCMVGDKVQAYTDDFIDTLADAISDAKPEAETTTTK